MTDDHKNFHLEPINSLIGEGAIFNGDFSVPGSIRIDGRFLGSVQSNTKVIVGENGYVKTNVQAKFVVVGGQVDGDIYASDSVHLMKTAKFYGNIISSHLIMDPGVIFEGRAQIRNRA